MKLTRRDWHSTFRLVGRVLPFTDTSFQLDKKSASGYVYSQMSIGIDCGPECGVVYAELMGGKSKVIYAHGKDKDGRDDYKQQITIPWEKRGNKSVLALLGPSCFLTAYLEERPDGAYRLPTAYDAIAYYKQRLTPGSIVMVSGDIKYSLYNGKLITRRVINSIALSNAKVENHTALFHQSVLLEPGCAEVDEENNGFLKVQGKVLDYAKEINGQEIKGQYPYPATFYFKLPEEGRTNGKQVIKTMFSPKSGTVSQVNFKGVFAPLGVDTSMEDLSDEMRALIACGVYTKAEILSETGRTNTARKEMVLLAPEIKTAGGIPEPQIYPERYSSKDLVLDGTEKEEEPNWL